MLASAHETSALLEEGRGPALDWACVSYKRRNLPHHTTTRAHQQQVRLQRMRVVSQERFGGAACDRGAATTTMRLHKHGESEEERRRDRMNPARPDEEIGQQTQQQQRQVE